MKLLIVDDEKRIRALIAKYAFAYAGFIIRKPMNAKA